MTRARRIRKARRFAKDFLLGASERDDIIFRYWFGIAQGTSPTVEDEEETKAMRAELRRLAMEVGRGKR